MKLMLHPSHLVSAMNGFKNPHVIKLNARVTRPAEVARMIQGYYTRQICGLSYHNLLGVAGAMMDLVLAVENARKVPMKTQKMNVRLRTGFG